MELSLSVWTHHLNHLLYSYFYYAQKHNFNIEIIFDLSIPHYAAVLNTGGERIFFDYSDDSAFLGKKEHYDFYFKRSLRPEQADESVYPLNFNVPLSYKSWKFLLYLKKDFLFFKHNRTELFRALDIFGLKSNSAHSILDIRNYPKEVRDTKGRIIFNTRLWNPENHPDAEEKERREKQNKFRIEACRIIKRSFKNSQVGLFPDDYSFKMAPDIILDHSIYRKKNYLKSLKDASIGIADDGLKDNPGWKLGEYLMYGKAIISTPIQVLVDDFKSDANYIELSNRSAYKELPDAISHLLKDNNYLEMAERNLEWSKKYIHPSGYIERILSVVKGVEI